MVCFVLRTKARKLSHLLVAQRQPQNEKNVSAVAKTAKANPHTCIWETISEPELSLGTDHESLNDSLHMRTPTAWWIPHNVTDVQKACRVDTATYLINNLFELNSPKRLTDVVTGD